MSTRSVPLALVLSTSLAVFAAGEQPARIHGIDLVWHWEGAGSSGAHLEDVAINPASVVKLATTLWALEVLGPDQRFPTRVEIHGTIDGESGVLRGDLVVRGGGDPDFHVENAQLLARQLFDLGVRGVEGTLYVDEAFWIGWEGGSEGTPPSRAERARKMARRLSKAWNPQTWTPQTLRAMRRYRENTPGARFLHLPVRQAAALDAPFATPAAAVEHVSNPLSMILKRFNDYSNNDIERLEHHLGGAHEMQRYYAERWGRPEPPIVFETLSGLGSNRMSPRQITRLIRDLKKTAGRHGLDLADLLPALGCGRNTLRNYRGLLDRFPAGSLVGKTGTLVKTDGGVIALAGSISTEDGDVSFFVGAPRNGARMSAARRAQTRWLLSRAGDWNPRGAECGGETLYSYQQARATAD